MIEIFLIIDFTEWIILKEIKKNHHQRLITKIKNICIKNCKTPDFRFYEVIEDSQSRKYELRAITNDNGLILVAVSSEKQP